MDANTRLRSSLSTTGKRVAWLVGLALVLGASVAANAAELERISNGLSGLQSNSDSFHPAISRDGRFVAFTSDASNLVTADTNARSDIFVYDRKTRAIERVSLGSAGRQGNGNSDFATISDDGRFVAFETTSDNLLPGDNNSELDVYLRDRQTGTTTLVSRNTAGDLGDEPSRYPSISGDGRYIAMQSEASNFFTPDSGANTWDIFVHDRVTGVTEAVSVQQNGQLSGVQSYSPDISRDGRHVAFTSQATNLANENTERFYQQTWVRDLDGGVTYLISKTLSDVPADNRTYLPVFSGDGSRVAFSTRSRDLWPDTASNENVFINDYPAFDLFPVSLNDDQEWLNRDSQRADLDDTGRYVAFDSNARNVPNPLMNNFSENIYVRDTQAATIERLSNSVDGDSGRGDSIEPSISGNGRYVAFTSYATDLIDDDTNAEGDIYLVDRGAEFDTTAPGNTYRLENNTWAMLSLPIEITETFTVEEIFADDITGAYGTIWVLFIFNPLGVDGPGYEVLDLDSRLRPGQGFWIFQKTGNAVVLDMPEGSRGVPTDFNALAACLSEIGCHDIPLSGFVDGEVQWNMIGNPFQSSVSVRFDDLRVTTATGICADPTGCSLIQGLAAEVLYDRIIRFGGSGFELVGVGDTLEAWEAYWLGELVAANDNEPVLQFPE